LIKTNHDDVGEGNGNGGDGANDDDDNNVAFNYTGGKKGSGGGGANVNNEHNANEDCANDDDTNSDDANDDDDEDDDVVNKIVDHTNASDISSSRSNSKVTTVLVDLLGTLSNELYDRFYYDNLFPSLKHYYGTKPCTKKYFSLCKGKKS